MLRKLLVLNLLDLGHVSYAVSWKLQKYAIQQVLVNRKLNKAHDILLLVEHSPCYTLGRNADSKNLTKPLNELSIPVYQVERGGDITWHGPGQIVAYPIFDLSGHKRDLHWFVRSVEETVINVLKSYNVMSSRNPINSGVWIGNNKIAAIGINASRWISCHGIALNVSSDLNYYNDIIPCGIPRDLGGVCKLESSIPGIKVQDVVPAYLKSFSELFQFEVEICGTNDLKGILQTLDTLKTDDTLKIL